MAYRKRTSAQRAIDLVEIENLSLQGKTQIEIAETLSNSRPYSISRQQIQYDVCKLEKIWAEEVKAEINTAKGRTLAEIKQLQREYWSAWQESKRDAEVQTVKQKGAIIDGEKHVTPIEAQKRTEGQSGNPAFLKGVEWCINKRCELLGLDAPKKTDLTTQGEKIGTDTDDLRNEILRKLDSIANARGAEQASQRTE